MVETVTAIIPAHNESDLIGLTVKAAKQIPHVSQVIVVDDASTDGTAEVAEQAGADSVIVLNENKGKGGALNAAWPYAEGSILLLLDGDLGASAAQGEEILHPVFDGDADMTIAIFCNASDEPETGTPAQAARSGGFGTVVRVARAGIRAMTGTKIMAPLSGQRAIRRDVVEKIGGFAPKFGVEVALTIDVLRMGGKVVEVPVSMVHRPSGRDLRGFIHRGKQFVDVLRALLGKVFSR